MTVGKPVLWGVLIGRSVRPLPKARNVTDANLHATSITITKGVKTTVVYRHSEREMWRKWSNEETVPTQLGFDLFDKEAQ
ncbi:hypothetical protein [Nocardia sp. NPDC051832]|uniref:hypothetical protein n=1 Tax=Nocardia sp. NPDC051832 TaxID=3155673 RepID=UPI003429048C